MMTILSAIVWFVPTDPSLPLSVVAAPSVNDGSAAVRGCGDLASIREGEMGIGTQFLQQLMLMARKDTWHRWCLAAAIAAYIALHMWLFISRGELKSVKDDFDERERKLVAQNVHQQSQLDAAPANLPRLVRGFVY